MKYSPKVAWCIWGVLVVGLGAIAFGRLESLLSGQATTFDLIVILLLIALLLTPMFPHVELFGLKFLQEISKEFDEVKTQINNVSTKVQSLT